MYAAIRREAVSSSTIMHTLAAKTMALHPSSTQKSLTRLGACEPRQSRSPLTGGGSVPREADFGGPVPGPRGAPAEKSIGFTSGGSGGESSSGTCGSSWTQDRSTIAAAVGVRYLRGACHCESSLFETVEDAEASQFQMTNGRSNSKHEW